MKAILRLRYSRSIVKEQKILFPIKRRSVLLPKAVDYYPLMASFLLRFDLYEIALALALRRCALKFCSSLFLTNIDIHIDFNCRLIAD
jgi:hypothetical protein